jgi:hypothetical protein
MVDHIGVDLFPHTKMVTFFPFSSRALQKVIVDPQQKVIVNQQQKVIVNPQQKVIVNPHPKATGAKWPSFTKSLLKR